MIAIAESAPPLKGTCKTGTLASRWNSSAARWGVVPLPAAQDRQFFLRDPKVRRLVRVVQWMQQPAKRAADLRIGVEQTVIGELGHEPVQSLVDLQDQELVEARLRAAQLHESLDRHQRHAAVAKRDDIGIARLPADQGALAEPAAGELAAQRNGAAIGRRDRPLEQPVDDPVPVFRQFSGATERLSLGHPDFQQGRAHLALHLFRERPEPG